MDRREVLGLLARNNPSLVARYGVDRLALFGSTVGSVMRAKLPRNPLLFDSLPAQPPEYNIVLMRAPTVIEPHQSTSGALASPCPCPTPRSHE